MAAEIVHHHNVAGRERRNENLINIGLEPYAVDRTIEGQRRYEPGQAKPGDEGRRFPIAVRDASGSRSPLGARPFLRAYSWTPKSRR